MTPIIIVAAGTNQDAAAEQDHVAGRAIVRMATVQTPEQVREATGEAAAIVVTTNPLTRAHIEALGPDVRVIGRAGTGLDAIDMVAADERGIVVYHTPDYCTAEVSTHAVAMILAVQRRLLDGDRVARSGFRDWRSVGPIRPMDELTAGVVGGGRIGQAVMARLMPLVGRVITHDPYATGAPDGVERIDTLDSLLQRSDILTLHLPLVEETRGMIGATQLALLPAGAIVVNVSRGGLVDEGALRDALASGHLAGAALDVLQHEPPPADDPVLATPGLLLTPHIAWYSTASERRVRTQVVDGVLACLAGEAPATGRIALDPRPPAAATGSR